MPDLLSSCTNIAAARPHGPVGVMKYLFRLIAIRSHRRRLKDMPDELLNDIGLTRDQARAEAARPVWDVPASWKM
ncbi:MAG: DUF1127 domain-containing protein [Paracoccaceae bacterium]